MSYYVIGPDGNRYGPADLEQLVAWAQDGRVVPQTTLEDTVTGERAPASMLPSLFPNIVPAYTNYPRQTVVVAQRKSPLVAGLLNLLLCGLGQVYNGQYLKGLAFFVGGIAIGLLTLGLGGIAVLIFAIVDAVNIANRINAGQAVEPWTF